MIYISDININGIHADRIDMINKILIKQFAKHHVVVKTFVIEDRIVFDFVKEKMLFSSSIQNLLPLKETDARYVKGTKVFLFTNKISEVQWTALTSVLTKTVSSLGFSCNIRWQEFKDDPLSLKDIVIGTNVVGTLPLPKSFPKGA